MGPSGSGMPLVSGALLSPPSDVVAVPSEVRAGSEGIPPPVSWDDGNVPLFADESVIVPGVTGVVGVTGVTEFG